MSSCSTPEVGCGVPLVYRYHESSQIRVFMLTKLSLRGLVCGLGLLLACHVATASTVVYLDRVAFLAAVTNAATDTFDDLTPGTFYTIVHPAWETPFIRSVGSYEYEARSDFKALGFTGTAADVFLHGQAFSGPGRLSFYNFGGSPYAVGGDFFVEDSNGLPSDRETWVSAGGVEYRATRPTPFIGFVSTSPIGGLTAFSPLNVMSANNLTFAGRAPVSVPAPGTLSLVAVSLSLLVTLSARSYRSRR